MKSISWFFRRSDQQASCARVQRAAVCIGAGVLSVMSGMAIAQNPTPPTTTPEPQITAPAGYVIHQTADIGGRIANINGSGAMYDTLVNFQTGPRVLGETFEMHALPDRPATLVDSLSAIGSGFGGDPYNFAKMSLSKGKVYEFSGLFRRDRQYFDYDLLGNPNVAGGQSIPIGPAAAPTGKFAWPQVNQSPFLYDTVRRMTDTSLTIFPLSKFTVRAGYSQGVFEGPSLSPSGYPKTIWSGLSGG